MNIVISVSGKLKEPFWHSAQSEYIKRLGRYCSLRVTECADNIDPSPPPGCKLTIACDLSGDHLTSEEFASLINSAQSSGAPCLCFLVGGSNGLSRECAAGASRAISFSRLTFPHHFFRIMLLEQLYRAFNALGGGKYHK